MKYLSASSVETPVDVKDFQLLKEAEYPYICAGIQIKNRFDQERINLNKKFKPKNIFHIFYEKGNVSCMTVKTVPLQVDKTFNPLIQQLAQKNIDNLEVYKNLLAEFDLSCDNCFAYFAPNTYPIDGKCINTITKNKINEETLYTKYLNTKEVPAYQSFGYFSIFILTHNPFITDNIKKEFSLKTGTCVA